MGGRDALTAARCWLLCALCLGLAGYLLFDESFRKHHVGIGRVSDELRGEIRHLATSDDDTADDDYDSDNDFPFTMKREDYDILPYFDADYTSTFLTYKFLEDYDGVVEPHANMLLASKTLNEYKHTEYIFNYTIKSTACESGKKCTDKYTGYYSESSFGSSVVSIPCNPYDTYSITVAKYANKKSWKLLRSYSGQLVCIYVRREIQSLTTSDLDATMDAMYAIWAYTEAEGQKLFGEDFHNSSYFTGAHDFNAAWVEADHIHEGLGFIPQHIKFTNLFEMAMQAVDPSISLPYWDYTIEMAARKSLNESFVFTADTFGSLGTPSDYDWGYTYMNDGVDSGKIPDGRWANLRADVNYAYPQLGNGYGYMRGAWNTNPSPYLTRFASNELSLPSCTAYYSFLEDNTDMATFLYEASFGPHASVHGAIGSTFGCDKMLPLKSAGVIKSTSDLLTICRSWSFALKELFRGHDIETRHDCAITAGTADCGFTCVDENYDEVKTKLKHFVDINDDLNEEELGSWRSFVCEGDGYKIFAGDHLESASPSDPSFWPIHGNLEKLLQAKYMVGGFAEFDWPTEATASKNYQEGYVCDKPNCYNPDYGDEKSYYADCCKGHFEHDRLLDFVTGNKSAGVGPTNRETLDGTNAASLDYNMEYIYDNFAWDHCTVDIVGLLEDFYTESVLDDDDDASSAVAEGDDEADDTTPINTDDGSSSEAAVDDDDVVVATEHKHEVHLSFFKILLIVILVLTAIVLARQASRNYSYDYRPVPEKDLLSEKQQSVSHVEYTHVDTFIRHSTPNTPSRNSNYGSKKSSRGTGVGLLLVDNLGISDSSAIASETNRQKSSKSKGYSEESPLLSLDNDAINDVDI